MTNRILSLLSIICIVALTACKKESTTTFTPPTPAPPQPNTTYYPDYMALKPGNYWIYQRYELDSANGAEHAIETYDSAYVEKDTVINQKTYHVYKYQDAFSFETRTRYLRDSLSYTVDQSGKIIFSSEDFSNVFSSYQFGPNASTDYTINIKEQMGFRDQTTIVSAGTFTTSTFLQIYTYPAGYRYGPTRQYKHSYAKGIGLIRETTGFYENLPTIYEKRLVRYLVRKKY